MALKADESVSYTMYRFYVILVFYVRMPCTIREKKYLKRSRNIFNIDWRRYYPRSLFLSSHSYLVKKLYLMFLFSVKYNVRKISLHIHWL